MSEDLKQPAQTFTEFMEAEGQIDEPLAPRSDEDILAAVFDTEFGDAAAREAIAIVRAKHPADFDLFQKVVAFIAPVYWPPDWTKIGLPEFIESMYVIVKHADFTAQIRLGILQAVQPLSSGRPN
ncbi:MAG: hypothetical protein ABSG41_26050 [Bryobacteraceae bacterium]|jgi:hypothetical protein